MLYLVDLLLSAVKDYSVKYQNCVPLVDELIPMDIAVECFVLQISSICIQSYIFMLEHEILLFSTEYQQMALWMNSENHFEIASV